MRVMVADRDPGVRGALRLLLTHDLGLPEVDEVADRADLWTGVQRTSPQLVVLEWGMLGAEAASLLARLRREAPGLRIVALSGHPEACRLALAAGADACISKADSPAQVRETLRADWGRTMAAAEPPGPATHYNRKVIGVQAVCPARGRVG